ncbi:MAG: hypothetical protein JSS98_15535 [Bacteroidetes bacterium]|nr:hypothetical protein [Bacteroidota bacterium]
MVVEKDVLRSMEKNFLFMDGATIGCISNCCIGLLLVGGEDSAHGAPHRLASPTPGNKLKYTFTNCLEWVWI